ncbi:hypothetical protein LCGC14_0417720 [marine sediment metagenome]|uniref:NodB homology domain-containing protein n=1 Tax=marine sediment metagenome TaxID=412755 RepID=A0A0F9VDP9_9ZZZZ
MNRGAITISVDDGHPNDFLVAELLRKHGLVATFYWSAKNPKHEVMMEGEMKTFVKHFPQMEIGQHTYSHRLLTRLTEISWMQEISQGLEWHERLFGTRPKSFCYPRGYYTPEIADFLFAKKYRCARSVINLRKLPKNMRLFEMDGGYHVFNDELRPSGDNKSYWLHSWEATDLGNLDRLFERLGKNFTSVTNTEYASNHLI